MAYFRLKYQIVHREASLKSKLVIINPNATKGENGNETSKEKSFLLTLPNKIA